MDQLHHVADAVGGAFALHRVDQAAAVAVGLHDHVEQRLGRHVLLHQHARQAALLERLRVEDLVAAAGLLRIGDQQGGLVQREDLAQRVGAGAGDQHVRAGVGVAHVLVEVFHLVVVFHALDLGIEVAPAAQVQDLEALGQLLDRLAHALVDGLRAAGAAHHHQHGPGRIQVEDADAFLAAAVEQLLAHRRTGDAALFAHGGRGLGEGAAQHLAEGDGYSVGQAGGHIGLVDQHRHAGQARAVDHRHGDEATLGEDDVRLDLSDQRGRLEGPLDHAERIGEVLHVEVPPQLAAFDHVIGDAGQRLDQTPLDAVGRADIVDLPALFFQTGDQRQVGGDVSGGAAACQDDLLHRRGLLYTFFH